MMRALCPSKTWDIVQHSSPIFGGVIPKIPAYPWHMSAAPGLSRNVPRGISRRHKFWWQDPAIPAWTWGYGCSNTPLLNGRLNTRTRTGRKLNLAVGAHGDGHGP